MNNEEQSPFLDVRALQAYVAPSFRLLFWLNAAIILPLLGGAIYLLYTGFILPVPAEAVNGQGWTQLLSMLLGLIFLLIALVQIIVILMLLRYRRFIFSPYLSHIPLLTAAILALLTAAVFIGLAVGFFSLTPLLALPGVSFTLLGIGWLTCFVRSLRLTHRRTADKASNSAVSSEGDG